MKGNPIASYLYLLCAQVLLLMMISNKTIKGIKIENEEYKILQFADDTTIFLNGNTDTLEIFGSLSGLKINMDKTKLVWLGRKKHSREIRDQRNLRLGYYQLQPSRAKILW